jgi:hypothetical protein
MPNNVTVELKQQADYRFALQFAPGAPVLASLG